MSLLRHSLLYMLRHQPTPHRPAHMPHPLHPRITSVPSELCRQHHYPILIHPPLPRRPLPPHLSRIFHRQMYTLYLPQLPRPILHHLMTPAPQRLLQYDSLFFWMNCAYHEYPTKYSSWALSVTSKPSLSSSNSSLLIHHHLPTVILISLAIMTLLPPPDSSATLTRKIFGPACRFFRFVQRHVASCLMPPMPQLAPACITRSSLTTSPSV